MKKCLVLLICCAGSTLPCKKAQAQERDRLLFGVTSNFSRSSSSATPNTSMGLFLNYATSKKSFINLELRKHSFFGLELNSNTGATDNSVNKFLLRDWSTTLSFNYCLRPVRASLLPYVSFGAGQYYVQGSRANIKRVKENPEESNIDYEMRKYFRNPGVFGAASLQLQAAPRTQIFIQTRYSIIFDDGNSAIVPSSKFTDSFNVTAGFRINLN
jgi:hypothetical protein